MTKSRILFALLLSALLAACGSPSPGPGGPAVQSVTVSPATASVQVGETAELTATVSVTGGASQAVTWSSSDDSIASVDSDGVVTGVAAGSATITATSVFDENRSGSAEVTVTAEAPVTVDCSNAQTLSENITTDQTLPLDCFTVTTNITISAALTLQPGTVLRFNSGAGFRVADGGSLRAQGNATNPIRLTSTSGDPNDWRGVGFFTSSSNNLLEYVIVENAGLRNTQINGFNYTNVYVDDNARVAIRNSTFRNAGGGGNGVGLYVNDASAELTTFENNTFDGNSAAAMRITAQQVGQIGSGNVFGTNALPGAQHIQVAASTLRTSATWPAVDVAYRLSGSHFVDDPGATLTIQAGATLEFASSAGLRVNAGTLRVLGTSDAGVTFTSASGNPNDWRGLAIASNSANNTLEYVTIENAGQRNTQINGFNSTNFFLASDSQVAISNSTFGASAGYGIYVDAASASFSTFSGNEFINNTSAPIRLYSNQLGSLGSGNTFGTDAPFGGRFLEVRDTTVTTTQSWQATDIPYRFFGNHFINDPDATVTIEAGATLQFNSAAGLRVNAGTLRAVGTSGNRITFTSGSGNSGDWRGLAIASGSNNVLDFVTIENAGQQNTQLNNFRSTNLYVAASGNVQLTNATLISSSGFGVTKEATGTITDATGAAVAGADAAAFTTALQTLGNSFSGNASGNVNLP